MIKQALACWLSQAGSPASEEVQPLPQLSVKCSLFKPLRNCCPESRLVKAFYTRQAKAIGAATKLSAVTSTQVHKVEYGWVTRGLRSYPWVIVFKQISPVNMEKIMASFIHCS